MVRKSYRNIHVIYIHWWLDDRKISRQICGLIKTHVTCLLKSSAETQIRGKKTEGLAAPYGLTLWFTLNYILRIYQRLSEMTV